MKSIFKAIRTLLIFSVMLISCEKEVNEPPTTPTNCDSVCVVKGLYSGSFTNQFNSSAPFAYEVEDNNFISGSSTLSQPRTAFGSYSNTCDSIKMKSWNTINQNYYYFAGRFSNNRTLITGIYKNLSTTTESGTFTLVKQ